MNKNEYELQHFEFSVEQFSLERRHFLKNRLDTALKSLLQKIPCKNAETINLLAAQKDEVHNHMLEALAEPLKSAEELDRKTFSIPPHVLLAADFGHSKQYTKDDEKQLDEEIESMKRLFLENSIMIAALKMESAQYDTIANLAAKEMSVHAQVEEIINSTDSKKMRALVDATKSLVKRD